MAADFTYTFDTAPFNNAMKSIEKGFTALKNQMTGFDKTAEKHGVETAQKTEKAVKNFGDKSKDLISGLTKRVAQLGAAYLGFKALLKYIPEIGTAFQSAGNIFLRNFLWPLRQYLIPLLQKMLAWVRDNRSMFVKWGTVLMNAFRGVVEIVKGLFGLIKSFLAGFSNTFKNIFGTTAKSVTELINMLLFKVTVLAQFIITTLKPVFEKLGEWVAVFIGALTKFWSGLSKGFGDIATPFIQIKTFISDIIKDIGLADTATVNWMSGFKKWGEIVGGTLRTLIDSIMIIIDAAYILGQTLYQLYKWTKPETWMDTEAVKKQWEETRGIYERFGKRFMKYGKDMGETWNRIGEDVRKPIEEVKPKVKELPVKTPVKVNTSGNINSKIEANYSFNITTPSDARIIGETLGRSHAKSFYDEFKKGMYDAKIGVASA